MNDEAYQNALLALGSFRGQVQLAEKRGMELSLTHAEARELETCFMG